MQNFLQRRKSKILIFTIIAGLLFLMNPHFVFGLGSGQGGQSNPQDPIPQQGGQSQSNSGGGTSSCGSTADCPTGQICKNNACIVGTGDQSSQTQSIEASGSCSKTSDCASGQTCENFVCVGPSGTATINSGNSGTATNLNLGHIREQTAELNKLRVTNAQQLIGILIRGAMGVLGTVALVMMIYGGVTYMTARGNSEKTAKGLETILWAGLGVMIIFASYALVNFVFDVFR